MIIAIVGKTNSGKDSIAKRIEQIWGIPMLVSYTTRPKRDYEVNGKEHWFVTPEKMALMRKSKKVLAYTRNDTTGIEYCAMHDFGDKPIVYIINPDGIKWLKEHSQYNQGLTVIYVHTDEDIIINRGIARGDNPDVLNTRLASERQEFDAFYTNKEFDYCISNNAGVDALNIQVDKIMQELGFMEKGRYYE